MGQWVFTQEIPTPELEDAGTSGDWLGIRRRAPRSYPVVRESMALCDICSALAARRVPSEQELAFGVLCALWGFCELGSRGVSAFSAVLEGSFL